MFFFAIDHFECLAKKLFGDLFDPELRESETQLPSYLVSFYLIGRPRTMEEIHTLLRETGAVTRLYHWRPTQAVDAGQRSCYYSNPKDPIKFKLAFLTNERGLVDRAAVTIYDSREVMRVDLLHELELTASLGGELTATTKKDLSIDFI